MRLYVRVRVYAWAACPFVYNGCVCWDEEERRIASRLPKPGSSGGHNRSRLTQRAGLQQVGWKGRGWGGERSLRGEPGQPRCELQPHGDEEHRSSWFFHSSPLVSRGSSFKNCPWFRADWRVWDQVVISLLSPDWSILPPWWGLRGYVSNCQWTSNSSCGVNTVCVYICGRNRSPITSLFDINFSGVINVTKWQVFFRVFTSSPADRL